MSKPKPVQKRGPRSFGMAADGCRIVGWRAAVQGPATQAKRQSSARQATSDERRAGSTYRKRGTGQTHRKRCGGTHSWCGGRCSTKQAPPPAWSLQCTLPLWRPAIERTRGSRRPPPPARSLGAGRGGAGGGGKGEEEGGRGGGGAGALAGAGQAVEGLEDAFALVRGHARATVADLHLGVALAALE